MIDEDDLAAWLYDTEQLVESRRWIRHDRHHVRRDDAIEGAIRKREPRRVHAKKPLNAG